jgi:hypothetical protein
MQSLFRHCLAHHLPSRIRLILLLITRSCSDYYSALSFEILGQVPVITATNRNGSLVAAFNDIRNNNYLLLGGQSYTVTVSGTTKSNVLGGYGIVSLTSANGTVSPVPEPESYAMFLAGLGLMGAIARRRSSKRAA